MTILKIDKEDWKNMSESAHMACFKEVRPVSTDRADFALLATEDDKALGYITCMELDANSVYMQYGGCFPTSLGTVLAYRSYYAAIRFLKERYKNVNCYIKNDNFVMLKFAMKSGFRIIGVKNKNGDILLEHTLI